MQSLILATILLTCSSQKGFDRDQFKLTFEGNSYGLVQVTNASAEVPLRRLAEMGGFSIEVPQTGYVSLTTSDYSDKWKKREEFKASIITEIYVNNKFKSIGIIKSGQTYIRAHNLKDLGFRFQSDSQSDTFQIARIGMDFEPNLPGIPFSMAQSQPVSVKATAGGVTMLRPAIIDSKFNVEIQFARGFFNPTNKPISVDFQLVLFDNSGKVLAREKCSIFRVASTGGSYILEGSYGAPSNATSVSLTYITAWIPKDA